MKNRSLQKILSGVLVAGLMVSCMGMEESDPSSLQMPEVKTFEVKDNASLVFELTASVDKSLAGRIAECGFYYGKDKSMSGAEKVECKMLGGTFSADITLHEYGEIFYVCNYISNGTEGNEICSEVKSITVKELEDYVEFGEVTVISYDRENKVASVNVQCNVKDGVDVTLCGLCYGASRELTVNDIHVEDKLFTENVISVEIPDCNIGDTYYVRPYLYDGEELTYGDVVTLNVIMKPAVTTSSVSNISDYSATCGGNVTDDGGAEVTAKGIVWSTSESPTVSLSTKSVAGKGIGEFSSSMTGLLPGTKYYVRAYATNSAGTSYGDQRIFTTNGEKPKILAPANCHMIHYSGTYAFPLVKGNDPSRKISNVSSVSVLWESFGTSSVPDVGDIVSWSKTNGEYVFFGLIPDQTSYGNAVIAAKDASGTILWSWHIWVTEVPKEHVYANNAGVLMDRNLGACEATKGSVRAYGLYYQWGRKDPFLGPNGVSSDQRAASSASWPFCLQASQARGTIQYSIEHPMEFIASCDANADWLYSDDWHTDHYRWSSTKTIYDPCPAGWRVPDESVWRDAGLPYDGTYAFADGGIQIGSLYCSPNAWYPAAGWYYCNDPLYKVGEGGQYWTVTKSANSDSQREGSTILSFDTSGMLKVGRVFGFHAWGMSVRCFKE